jgi:RNA polymerase sigma factor (sigma-70 family)
MYMRQDEAEIWKEFRNGSELAFSLIFSKHYSDLYSYGRKIAHDEEVVKDGIQELMITLWSSRERLGEVSSIRHYLLKSLRRSLIRASEKQRRNLLDLRLFSEYQPNITFSTEEAIILEESSQDTDAYLTTLLNNLPKRQKEAVYLKYYSELSFEEVADVMGVNYQSVVNHLHKAFKVLRKSKALSSACAPTGAMDM